MALSVVTQTTLAFCAIQASRTCSPTLVNVNRRPLYRLSAVGCEEDPTADRLEFYTPKHASWLNMVEIEIGVLCGQCLNRRIGECEKSRPRSTRKKRNNAKARQMDVHHRQGAR